MPLILITGSGRRIGKGLAIEFARKGWDVIFHYNKTQQGVEDARKFIEKNFTSKTYQFSLDLRQIQDISKTFEKAFKEFGVPDVLVNNAGIFPDKKEVGEIDEQLWDETLAINLKSYFFVSKIFSEYAKIGARIINIGSLGGIETWKGRVPYNISKAGVIQLTKSLAKELAPKIAVNCVSPGTILIPDEPNQIDSPLIPLTRIPMQRYGTIFDVFDAVYFFATCSNFITGQVIFVDGGYHLDRGL
ncbi:MAG: SDR family oxidoreductase [Ignavibacteria bacterium]|nr:SDR family oxidoreductase [Ignavibacteria bacterium]